MLWIIILTAVYFMLFGRSDDGQSPKLRPPCSRLEGEEEQAFKEMLKGKTEKELWELRNRYHAKLVEANGTGAYSYYLDCIGAIDKRIYSLRH